MVRLGYGNEKNQVRFVLHCKTNYLKKVVDPGTNNCYSKIMINKPGTLLVVRKRIHKKRPSGISRYSQGDGIHGIFGTERKVHTTDYRGRDQSYQIFDTVDLKYGEAVMLLDLEPSPVYRCKNRIKMYILRGDKKLYGYLSKSQINKWFTFPNVWKKYHAEENVENSGS